MQKKNVNTFLAAPTDAPAPAVGNRTVLLFHTFYHAVQRGPAVYMYDEILPGYAVADFLQSEKSASWSPETKRSYTNCLWDLLEFARDRGELTPEHLQQWEQELQTRYARSAVNIHLAAANNYFRWCGRYDLLRAHVRAADAPRPTPALTRTEYLKLLRAARSLGRHRTYLLVKLFVTTDVPLQCLHQVTADLVRQGHGTLNYRGSPVAFYCPAALQRELLEYMALNGIYRGPVFVTRGGKPLERPGIFRSIRELCRESGVPEEKGNPRALRNLYKATQREIENRLAVLKRQMIDQAVELEQDAVGWTGDGPAGREHPA